MMGSSTESRSAQIGMPVFQTWLMWFSISPISHMTTHLSSYNCQTKEYYKYRPVPPLWHLWIVLHQLVVNVVFFEADALKPIEEGASVVEYSVHNDVCAQGEGNKICDRERGGQIERRVLLVRSQIKRILRSEHPGHVVRVTEAIIGLVAKHGEVCKIPSLRAGEDGQKDEQE